MSRHIFEAFVPVGKTSARSGTGLGLALTRQFVKLWRHDPARKQAGRVWMDLRMSGMDGAETARQICALEDGLEVKIAAVGASVFADERNRVLAAGLDDFEAKPYRSGEIFHCMACQLGVRYHRN